MAEFNPGDEESCKREVIVLQTVQSHHALVKSNRMLLTLVYLLIAVVFVLGFVLLPRQNLLEELGRNKSLAYTTQNTGLSTEINNLKGQMFGLVSGSIESKLKSLEVNIRRGSITDSLDTLQELKGDVKILSSYSLEPAVKTEQALSDQSVIKELSELKGLIYLTIASCGLMIAALAGVWLRHRYRLTHQQKRAFLSRKE